ncbi:MAG TPA: hypothetical protein VMQ99_12240 [Acetobacteraceae bacterium]|nr:hypothetical protein [Acetobacteraceae bacterium]
MSQKRVQFGDFDRDPRRIELDRADIYNTGHDRIALTPMMNDRTPAGGDDP